MRKPKEQKPGERLPGEYTKKDFARHSWPGDLNFYLAIKAICERPNSSEFLKDRLAARRLEMVKRYGETAMKGI